MIRAGSLLLGGGKLCNISSALRLAFLVELVWIFLYGLQSCLPWII